MTMAGVLVTVDVDTVTPMIDDVPREHAGRHVDELEQRLFGLRVGVPRVLAALADRGLLATFFVPGIVAERSPQTVARIVDAGHEVGLHGWRHTSPRMLEVDTLRADLDRSRAALAAAGASDVVGYRAPEWHMSEDLLDVLVTSGMRYDSSLGGFESPYRLACRGGPEPLVEVPVSWALDDAPHLLCTSRSYARPADATQLGERWVREVTSTVALGGVAVVTVHPWIIGRGPAFPALTTVLDHLAAPDAPWSGTVTELLDRTDLHATPVVDPLDALNWWEEQ
ncbi:polysaccharide deacetylase family protein [Nocardioides sp. Y6]|uniref:Polysaccharide deacetylase family protein n=1 Tax=Nocardioides malaquae TaxID=2773426 RepID=A0ABR9RNE1_9ACTN|nr:polysaccharide deacetylase family protein [Nocardioides malaquae]MBE7323084.1 polysaccharide deacetylase family protein [Nocardioides malaquae]